MTRANDFPDGETLQASLNPISVMPFREGSLRAWEDGLSLISSKKNIDRKKASIELFDSLSPDAKQDELYGIWETSKVTIDVKNAKDVPYSDWGGTDSYIFLSGVSPDVVKREQGGFMAFDFGRIFWSGETQVNIQTIVKKGRDFDGNKVQKVVEDYTRALFVVREQQILDGIATCLKLPSFAQSASNSSKPVFIRQERVAPKQSQQKRFTPLSSPMLDKPASSSAGIVVIGALSLLLLMRKR